MFCHYCGQQLCEDMSFCVRCGRPTTLSADTTGPLPRLDEQGNPVALADKELAGDTEAVAAGEGAGTGEGGAAAEGHAVTGDSAGEGNAAGEGVGADNAAGESDAANGATSADAVGAADGANAANGVASADAASASFTSAPAPTAAKTPAAISVTPLAAGVPGADDSTAPVIMLRKSRKPLVVGFVVAALLIGCLCFAGGLLAATIGVVDLGKVVPALATGTSVADSSDSSQSSAGTAGETGSDAEDAAGPVSGLSADASTDAETFGAADATSADASDDDLPGMEDAADVAAAVQEGWEAMIADNFSKESQATWTETVLSMQPDGVTEALGALTGVEGDSLMSLFLTDGLPASSKSQVKKFLDGATATVIVNQSGADKTAMAVLMGYFGDLGQTVSGQVESLSLPSDIQAAEVLEVSVAPAGESAQDTKALAISEKGQGYMAYEYEGRWYLFAPELQRAEA